MTKKKQIEIIEAMMENTLAVYESVKENNKQWSEELFREYMGMKRCYDILTNKHDALVMANIYEVEV
jgi:hypothetical protein